MLIGLSRFRARVFGPIQATGCCEAGRKAGIGGPTPTEAGGSAAVASSAGSVRSGALSDDVAVAGGLQARADTEQGVEVGDPASGHGVPLQSKSASTEVP